MDTVAWTDLDAFMRSKMVAATPKELIWLRQCWAALDEAGMTRYASDADLAKTLLRACVLLEILDEYKSLVLDTDLEVDAMEFWSLLKELFVCSGHADPGTERPLVVEFIEAWYTQAPEFRLWDDGPRLAQGSDALHRDMQRMLPLLRDTIEEHYKHPMVVPAAPPEGYEDMDIDEFVELDLEVRLEKINAWVDRGMTL